MDFAEDSKITMNTEQLKYWHNHCKKNPRKNNEMTE